MHVQSPSLSSKPSLPGQLYVQIMTMVPNLNSHLHYSILRVCLLKAIYSFPKIFKPPPTNCWLLAVCRMNSKLTKSPSSPLSWSSTPTFCPVSKCGALPHSSSPLPFPFQHNPLLLSFCTCQGNSVQFWSPGIESPSWEWSFWPSLVLWAGYYSFSCSPALWRCGHSSRLTSWCALSASSLTSGGTWGWLTVLHFCVLRKALHRVGTPFGCSVVFTHRRPDWINKKSSVPGLINFWHSPLFTK